MNPFAREEFPDENRYVTYATVEIPTTAKNHTINLNLFFSASLLFTSYHPLRIFSPKVKNIASNVV